MLPSGSFNFVSFYIIAGAIVGVAFIARYIFAPESEIASMLVLFGLGGVLIQFIKLILGLLISV